MQVLKPLPWAGALQSSNPALALGKALAETFGDPTEVPLPEPLARLVREIEEREHDRE